MSHPRNWLSGSGLIAVTLILDRIWLGNTGMGSIVWSLRNNKPPASFVGYLRNPY